ncbi:MAG: PqiC family protein [Deltaproteobacteria bacterium]|jgi:uncharacterized lipoprotein YmbA|nr:PqiC family protein [Deltaproteobacteria bacterium]
MLSRPVSGSGKTAWQLILILILAAAAGCISKPYPVINTFELDPADPGPPLYNKLRPYVLRVSTLSPAAAYESRKLIYRTRDGRLAEDFYNEFYAAPGRLLADSLASWLDRRSPDFQAVRIQGERTADFVLEGYLAELLGDFSQTPPQARISVTLTLNDIRRRRPEIVLSRTYQVQLALPDSGTRPAPELAQALARGWEQILKDAEQDINGYFRGQKRSSR